ncbi:MAG TPA: Na+/H+ antiporter NhaA [Casimicrobiaceae bacterium]|nr:Na+/H+ antiporter NhaA [Casimicrobiaceae bacterium]
MKETLRVVQTGIQRFVGLEASGGITLVAAAALAIIVMNSPWSGAYAALLDQPIALRVGDLALSKPLLLWVNDGLMAIFFFLVGLELKREFLEGELSTRGQIVLPVIAAAAGMAVPALVYVAFNWGDAIALNGWAIPAATDIAFALGVLTLLGPRVPSSLKIFLLALAIIDDLGAIVIIAIFYSAELSWLALVMAAVLIAGLLALNRLGITRALPYIVLAIALWLAVLKSGVHATLAGVIAACFVPLRTDDAGAASTLRMLEERLHPWVAYGILPLFAFTNAGVDFGALAIPDMMVNLPRGVAAGLFIGKQIGVFAAVFLLVKAGLARMPEGATWLQLYGVALLCGIGFTMSLFIGSLAFENQHESYLTSARVGVLSGSIISAVAGYLVLRLAPSRSHPAEAT